MAVLHCEIGNHLWTRDAQRGRPPKNCPEHQPPKEEKIKIVSSAYKTVSGPRTVEELVPGLAEALAEENMRTLHCEYGGGHDYEAPRRRGRVPRFCPEHTPEISRPNPTAALGKRSSELIEEILKNPRARICHCNLSPESTPEEIRRLKGGCTEPWYVCPTLDTVRRTLNL